MIDEAFRLHEGRNVGGMLRWAEHTAAGTRGPRAMELALAQTYRVGWMDYARVTDSSAGLLRYLALVLGIGNEKAITREPSRDVARE
jgi:hypothetical protein